MSSPAKVLFIGIDAADKDLILEWAAAGELPPDRPGRTALDAVGPVLSGVFETLG